MTIPKSITGSEELVVLPLKEFERLLSENTKMSENDVLKWSREAKKIKKAGKLPILRSLKSLR